MTDERAPAQPGRDAFATWWPMPTRWSDNDQYGHANNVVYYSWFDTAVNGWLMHALGRDVRDLPALGVVAETSCRFVAQVGFPDELEIGLAVERLGTSSITYRLGAFVVGADEPAALGRFVHVYVDPVTRRPVPVPDVVRAAVQHLTAPVAGTPAATAC